MIEVVSTSETRKTSTTLHGDKTQTAVAFLWWKFFFKRFIHFRVDATNWNATIKKSSDQSLRGISITEGPHYAKLVI
jgi:hypothetical protein